MLGATDLGSTCLHDDRGTSLPFISLLMNEEGRALEALGPILTIPTPAHQYARTGSFERKKMFEQAVRIRKTC